MNRKTLATMAALACLAVSAAMAQQKAAPAQKPKDKGPSLEVTMKFIQDKMNSTGAVNLVLYGHDGVSGNDWSNQFSFEVSGATVNVPACVVSFHFKSTKNAQSYIDQDAGIPLKLIENIIVMPIEQAFKEADTKGGNPQKSSRADPATFVLRAFRTGGAINDVYFQDQELANRVATAMVHAVEICGGGNKDPF